MNTLQINAHLKHIELVLQMLDNSDDLKTIGDVRIEFRQKFGTSMPVMLNQYFGVVRLIPLLLMREQLKNENQKYDRNITIIRHSLAHDNFHITETGYEFVAEIGTCKLTYSEFVEFIWWTENEFYARD